MKLIPNDGKYITTIDFNIFLGAIFDEILIQTKLGTNSNLNTVEEHSVQKNYNCMT